MLRLKETVKSLLQKTATYSLKEYNISPLTRKCSIQNKEEILFKEGNNIEGFIVNRVCKIPEIYLTAIELNHVDTGAEYIHLARNDMNNAFSVGFRTTPFDSTGVPHILEHLCTCGSEKYPCRDPYFKMLCRSMATFMNAMTGPDYTIYPFSTQNHRDYMNLMSVYLDAVFQPLLRRSDFSQEGWRLEHRDINDRNTPIIFKGVVLNEMKGVFSDNQTIFYECIMNYLLPSHTYGVISGGDPICIPTLTYEALLQFHKKHYHPSNAKFYSYGNFPLQQTLRFLNDDYLSHFGKVDKKYSEETYVPLEPRWTSPKRQHIDCRVDKMANPEMQSSLGISHLCGDVCDVEDSFTMNVISELLVNGPNSPLYRTLVEPNISSGFSSSTGYCNSTRSTFFSVALQGLNPKDFDWIIDTYDRTIDDVVENGFEDKNIEGVLHSIELGIKHQAADFGLSVLFNITSPWIHNADVFEFLKVNKCVSNFKQQVKDNPKFLQDYVAKYFKTNTHRLVLSMSPSEDYDQKIIKLEEELLQSKLSGMSAEQIRAVYDEGILLKQNQELTEDISCLPTLKVSDLNKDIENIDLINTSSSKVPVQLSIQPTNGLVYFHALLNLDDIPDENKDMLPIFCYMADKLGTPYNDYRKFDQEVLLSTKGLNFNYLNSESLTNINKFEEGIHISSLCLVRNAERMFQLWSDVFTIPEQESVFENKERFQTLVSELAANYLNSVTQNGHLYAMLTSSSLVNDAAKRKELCSGISMVRTLQRVSQPSEIDETINAIRNTASFVLDKSRLKVAINTTPEDKNIVLRHLNTFCASDPEVKEKYKIDLYNLEDSGESEIVLSNLDSFRPSNHEVNENYKIDLYNLEDSGEFLSKGIHHVIPGQVSFAGKSVLTVPYTHEDFAPLRVLCRLITMKYCIPVIREKGGAYGAGLSISVGGMMSFYSYRDPNPIETHAVFDDTYEWILKNEFTKQDVEEAKLGTFQAVDAPVPPGEKGLSTFLYGLDNATLRSHRLALMAVTGEDFLRVASKYLRNNKAITTGRSLLGPRNELVIKRADEAWTVIE